MHTAFYIDISIKTKDGPQQIGRFNLGSSRSDAFALFKILKGSPDLDHKDVLYIEFMEVVNGLPVNLNIKACDLHDLGTNCMMITQEIFRISNIRPK